MAELTDRQWDVLAGVKARKIPSQIAADMGISQQYVANLLGQLRELGVIRRRGELPPDARSSEVYPWELVEDQPPPTWKPALPPAARLRLEYPQDSQRDLTVPPIRHVWWGQWSVQSIPMARPDGKRPKVALPKHRVVVATHLEATATWLMLARLYVPWLESDTLAKLEPLLTNDDTKPMSLVIAAAIGVDAVFDLTEGDQ